MAKRGPGSGRTGPAKDNWNTPLKAFLPLLPYLDPDAPVTECCAGERVLVDHMRAHGITVAEAYDLKPRARGVRRGNALRRVPQHLAVTNPPFSEKVLMPILTAATGWPLGAWMLLPLDTLSNRYFAPVAPHVQSVLPIGRVSWMENGKGGYENYCWVRIDPDPAKALLPRC